MKRTLIIVGSIVGLILLILICASLFGPTIAKNYLQDHSKELIGRQVWVDELKMNFFSGRFTVKGFKLMEQNGKDVFASFDTLDVSVKLRKLVSKELYVRRITLTEPNVRILQNGSRFNFSDLLENPKKKEKTDTTKSNFTFSINKIKIRQGSIFYKDIPLNGVWDMRRVDLDIPGIYFSGKSTNVGLDLNFASGGSLKSKSDYNMETGRYLLNIRLKDFDIKGALPYLQQHLKVGALTGLLSADVNISGDANHIMDLTVKGRTSIRNLSITDNSNARVLSIAMAAAEFKEINLKNNAFLIESVKVAGGDIDFTLLKDGNSFSKLLLPSKPSTSVDTTSKKANEKIQFGIGSVKVSSFNINFKDNTLRKPFSYKISNIIILADNVKLYGNNNAKIRASLPGGGSAALEWSGEIASIANQNLSVDVKNMALKYFTPYVEEYTAYPLIKGVLSVSSINHIKNYRIAAQNKLEAYEVEAGNKNKTFKPAVKVPLKTALYIIKDKDDKVKMEVPVTGIVNSPEFSYRKIVLKTIANLLIKVAVAPVNFLGKQLGIKSDIPESISFDLTQVELNTQQNAVLSDFASILSAKPELSITFVPYPDTISIKQQMAFERTRKEYYRHTIGIKDSTLTLEQQDAVKRIKIDNHGFVSYVDSLIPADGSIFEKLLLLPSNQNLDAGVGSLLEQQYNSIVSFMVVQHGVDRKRVKVGVSQKPLKKESTLPLTLYKVQLGIDGEDLSVDQ